MSNEKRAILRCHFITSPRPWRRRSCFGFFNLLSAVLCIPLLHHSASLYDFSVTRDATSSPSAVVTTALVAGVLLPGVALYFPMNAWINLYVLFWPGWLKTGSTLRNGVFAAFRSISQFRVLQCFGVFPPWSAPPMRWCPVFEGSDDGRAWARFHLACNQTDERSTPLFLSPYHPRLEIATFYLAVTDG